MVNIQPCNRRSTLLVMVVVSMLLVAQSQTSAFSAQQQLEHGRGRTRLTAAIPDATKTPASVPMSESKSESSRRDWIRGVVATATAAGTSTLLSSPPMAARAEDAVVAVAEAAPVVTPLEMKEFVDPAGLFSLRVPKGFYTLRRTQKGDLPDAKTGKGRRGSSIFTAGNMAKAEVVAVERFPARVLLEENGIEATGDLGTFPGIGDARAVASLIILRREKDTQNQGTKTLDSVEVTPDGKTLTFRLKTEIDVQKPELLLEQMGVSRLFRVTVAKATLNSEDGNIMAIFASALEQDFTNGVDGPALEDTVRSFEATKQQ